jgi:GT2 family glycosyltransferase
VVGDERFYVRGVTYGTFRPRDDESEFPEPEIAERDFELMARCGVNAVRVYSVPPIWLLDAAQRCGLRVLVGLPVERYIGYLADPRKRGPDVMGLVRSAAERFAGHPAVLAYSIGNEIPAAVARWHGAKRIERYLERLYHAAKDADPEGLVTYASYPSTEYLSLPFLDLACFNVFLESPERLESYLGRLQTLAGDRPLVMGELGLDAYRNGDLAQSRSVDWQVRTAFGAGSAGVFVYSWTDEWYRGGEDVRDWRFGLTTRDRRPKPALHAVRRVFAESPFPPNGTWPKASVVICTYNGSRTLRESLEACSRLDYPDYEVIVVDDGSTDETAAIAREYPCRLISTENRGLSRARNTGYEEATGSIIAYIDDDAYPDPHWLRYLATTFERTGAAAVGGPNLSPHDDGWIADCVGNAPGNPVHVLVSDHEAEHIPGCNMAFRKSALETVGGFDPLFRVAGDDVDLCWRITDAGMKIGFSPAAVVWHHRRNSVRAFWRQQRGYGRAEAMLERKWPERHDQDGHIAWEGRIYGKGAIRALTWRRSRIYHGVWGMAPYQSLYEPAPGVWASLVQTPLWYLTMAALAVLSLLSLDWSPLRITAVAFALGLALSLVQAGKNAAHATFSTPVRGAWDAARRRIVIAALYLAQPAGRLWSRLMYRAKHPQPRGKMRMRDVRPRKTATWSETWTSPEARLTALESALRREGGLVRRGGNYDRWDLEIRWGAFGCARALMAVEEHGGGSQLARIRTWPSLAGRGPLLVLGAGSLALGAAVDGAWMASLALGAIALFFAARTLADLATAGSAMRKAVDQVSAGP